MLVKWGQRDYEVAFKFEFFLQPYIILKRNALTFIIYEIDSKENIS